MTTLQMNPADSEQSDTVTKGAGESLRAIADDDTHRWMNLPALEHCRPK